MAENIKKERHAGFELLRVVSMMMIVLMHIIGHGGLGNSAPYNTAAHYIYWLIYAFCRVSTNCFVMITGYYMVKSQIRFSRVFRIWCEVLFYSVLTYLFACKAGIEVMSFCEIIKVFTPVSSGEYWFATGYVVLYLCIPLLNRIINGISSKSEFKKIIFTMLALTSLLPTILYWSDPLYVNGGYSYIWFIVLYFIAAYIRIYDIKVSKRTLVVLYAGLALITPAMRIAAEVIQTKIGATTLVDNIMDYKMPVTVVMSVAFFMLFKNLEIKNITAKKVIAALAPMSFGVYLLHDSGYTREFLWKKINMVRFDGVCASLRYMILVAAIIIISGYAVNLVYQSLYKLFLGRKAEEKIEDLMKMRRKN